MPHKRTLGLAYTILHFMVDFTTIYMINSVLLGPKIGIVDRGSVIIVYNIIAFAGQLPIGVLADVINKNKLFAMIGCAISGLAYPVALISPWLACVLAALGNGFFHIGGGVDVLQMSMPKAGMSGVFVSSGAMGLWLAYRLNNYINMWFFPVLMIGGIVWLALIGKLPASQKTTTKIRYEKPKMWILVAVFCFAMTIVIRSLLGMAMNFPWKSIATLSLICALAVSGGKAVGGFIADKFGHIKTAAISLLISLVLFPFSYTYWYLGVVAVLCFNMTMPLTLTAIASVSKGKYGFAFGITTFALAIGFIPVVFGLDNFIGGGELSLGVLISMILIISGYIILKRDKNVDIGNPRS